MAEKPEGEWDSGVDAPSGSSLGFIVFLNLGCNFWVIKFKEYLLRQQQMKKI